MPDESVAMNLFLLSGSIISDSICASKSENSTRGLGRFPFHGIFGGDRSEICVVVDDGSFAGVDGIADRESGAEEIAAFSDDGCVETYWCSLLLIVGNAGYVRNNAGRAIVVHVTYVGFAEAKVASAKVAILEVEKCILAEWKTVG